MPPRFELGIAALQAAALPLGDGTSHHLYVDMVPGAGLEPAQYCYRGILSPLRLPISPPGQLKFLFLNNYCRYTNKLNGAGNEVRTRDPNLGKVVLYH